MTTTNPLSDIRQGADRLGPLTVNGLVFEAPAPDRSSLERHLGGVEVHRFIAGSIVITVSSWPTSAPLDVVLRDVAEGHHPTWTEQIEPAGSPPGSGAPVRTVFGWDSPRGFAVRSTVAAFERGEGEIVMLHVAVPELAEDERRIACAIVDSAQLDTAAHADSALDAVHQQMLTRLAFDVSSQPSALPATEAFPAAATPPISTTPTAETLGGHNQGGFFQ